MNCFGESACLALTLAGIVGAAAADEDQAQAGREVFDQRCRNCHGGTASADYPIGASLVGNRCDLLIPAMDWLRLLLKSD
jgi:mono/diheme cytochrome c family protein